MVKYRANLNSKNSIIANW